MIWSIKKFQGGNEFTLRARITLKENYHRNIQREIGPIAMEFEVPMLSTSNLQVRYLRVSGRTTTAIHRWVRYITAAASYACRLT